jgi:hypothetical protein
MDAYGNDFDGSSKRDVTNENPSQLHLNQKFDDTSDATQKIGLVVGFYL